MEDTMKRLEKTPFAKAVRAMDLLYKAAELLREGGEQVLAETGNHAAAGDFKHFEAQIRAILIDDEGDAGLEPWVNGMKSGAK
jgi:hypothetical protein